MKKKKGCVEGEDEGENKKRCGRCESRKKLLGGVLELFPSWPANGKGEAATLRVHDRDVSACFLAFARGRTGGQRKSIVTSNARVGGDWAPTVNTVDNDAVSFQCSFQDIRIR